MWRISTIVLVTSTIFQLHLYLIEIQLQVQYIPRNMHTVFALLCFVVVIHWLIFPYPSGLLHLHCGNLTIAPVPAKQPWWIWINTSCEFILNDCITTTKQSTTKPCAYFLGYTVRNGSFKVRAKPCFQMNSRKNNNYGFCVCGSRVFYFKSLTSSVNFECFTNTIWRGRP